MAKVIIGLSGGVDSAVAAALLLEHGHDVEALFMKNWEEDDTAEYCAAAADLADAEQVSQRLGIPLHTVNFASEYWDRVFEHFLAEYRAGKTPNPDVLCNSEIKFKAFLDHARALGADHVATGHYATVRRDHGGTQLHRAQDTRKDQTYFLHALTQAQLAPVYFPLGERRKPDVRRLARSLGLANHAKKDSTGICFIGEQRLRDFLQRFLPAQPGDIVTADGAVIGHHQGLMYYTIGQRRGLGVGGRADAGDAPWFVMDKDLAHNRLIVVQGHDHPGLFHPALKATQAHWIAGRPPRQLTGLSAQIRYRQAAQPCELLPVASAQWIVRFAEPQWAVAPGQYVVFYDGDQCLGGAVITQGLGADAADHTH